MGHERPAAMGFPDTRLTLIQRLAAGGTEADWRQFVNDYWGPVCRFALRWGARSPEDAEDIAIQTFEVLWQGRLLVRWVVNRSAKLRSLLCGVVRNLLANQGRVRAGRQRLAQELASTLPEMLQQEDQLTEAFYASWVEDLVQRAVDLLGAELLREGKGDYLRVLYGRICQGLTTAEIAGALELRPGTVARYFRRATRRLGAKLQQALRFQMERYSEDGRCEDEFTGEWQRLGCYLTHYGGLEEAVRRSYGLWDPVRTAPREGERLAEAIEKISTLVGAESSPREIGGSR
ncbi:MAG: RNA polymerase sigma factor [Thermoguttaceae bacterium]